jgi:hypothetical protein
MFVYGGLLLVCVGCSGIALAVKPPDQIGLEAALDKEAPGHTVVSIVGVGFNLLFGVTFIAAGFGVLWLSQIARFVTYTACLGIILVTAANTTYQALIVSPVTERLVAQHVQQVQGQAPPFNMGTLMMGSRIIGMAIAIGIPLVFCVPIVILLSVKSARNAFAGVFPAEPPEDEGRPRYGGYEDDNDYPRSKPPEYPGDTGIKE